MNRTIFLDINPCSPFGSQPKFWTNMSPLSSGSKKKPNKIPAFPPSDISPSLMRSGRMHNYQLTRFTKDPLVCALNLS
jgi:hypothetical protein